MEPEIPAGSTQIGQDARGVIGQTVIGATVIYGSVTIIQGSQAGASEGAASPAAKDDTTPSALSPAEQGPNPYQGLLAFQPSDGDRFFGRATEIEDLWQRFRALHEQADATRLLVVYGPSGSGKSSLVRAGLVPELARRPPGGRAQARIALLVPGSQPLQALAGVLARIATNDPAPVRKTREFAEELALANGAGEHDGLQRIAALLPEADVWPLVVVVDQLEELYSLCPEAAMRQAFLANLLLAAADRSGQVAVLVTLRSDFLGATQADPALNQLIQAQGVFVAALSEQGLRDAIRLPAEQRGRPLDAASVELLVEQSLGRDGALPLLQFALLRIWEGLLRGQPAAETLRQIGGVGGALAGEADRIQASLPDGDQRIARRLFLNLVQLGEGSRDTRRRVALQEVIAHGEDPAATQRVIEGFASPAVRLITRSSGQDGRETLELSHEALIEAWPLLREWLNASRADLRFQRRLEEAARHWEDSGTPEGSLWRPPDLVLLERFRAGHDADLTELQLAFAEASRRAERGRQQRERRTQMLLRGGVVALSGLSLLALGSGGFAWQQLRQARAAQALQFEATHRALVQSDPFSSLVYGLAAAEPLLDGQHPWEAGQLSASLPVAAAA
ncbi:MAG: AAA family ATPase, partial [Synechococcaceae cyanobacterium]